VAQLISADSDYELSDSTKTLRPTSLDARGKKICLIKVVEKPATLPLEIRVPNLAEGSNYLNYLSERKEEFALKSEDREKKSITGIAIK
jgi:hypothetical protein